MWLNLGKKRLVSGNFRCIPCLNVPYQSTSIYIHIVNFGKKKVDASVEIRGLLVGTSGAFHE